MNACLPRISFFFFSFSFHFFSHPLILFFLISLFFLFFTRPLTLFFPIFLVFLAYGHTGLPLALSMPRDEEHHCSTKQPIPKLPQAVVTTLTFTLTHKPHHIYDILNQTHKSSLSLYNSNMIFHLQ